MAVDLVASLGSVNGKLIRLVLCLPSQGSESFLACIARIWLCST